MSCPGHAAGAAACAVTRPVKKWRLGSCGRHRQALLRCRRIDAFAPPGSRCAPPAPGVSHGFCDLQQQPRRSRHLGETPPLCGCRLATLWKSAWLTAGVQHLRGPAILGSPDERLKIETGDQRLDTNAWRPDHLNHGHGRRSRQSLSLRPFASGLWRDFESPFCAGRASFHFEALNQSPTDLGILFVNRL